MTEAGLSLAMLLQLNAHQRRELALLLEAPQQLLQAKYAFQGTAHREQLAAPPVIGQEGHPVALADHLQHMVVAKQDLTAAPQIDQTAIGQNEQTVVAHGLLRGSEGPELLITERCLAAIVSAL